MKKYKIILSVLLVVLVAVAVVVVTGVVDIHKQSDPEEPTSGNKAETENYEDAYTLNTSVALPLMKTDFETVFYTMTKQGDVKFYEVNEGKITSLEETGSFEVTAACSSQELPAVIHYIEKDGHTYGVGLFTNLLYPDVLIYDYAFFKVTDMFPQAGLSDDSLLMVLDVDNARFYDDNKVYSEIFVLHPDHSSEHFLSEDQRTVDLEAKMKTDYKMFTNDTLAKDQADEKNVLFLSSRYYADYRESGKTDIFSSGGFGTNTDNLRYVIDVDTLHFWRDEGDTYFFRDNEDGSFSLKAYYASGETETIAVFEGDLSEDYLIDGQYLFNKKTGKVTDVLTNRSKQVIFTCFKSGFTADLFAISENGKYAVIRGVNTNNTAGVGVMNFETDEIYAYTDDVFGYVANMNVLNDGTVVISAASGESAAAYYQLISSAVSR